MSNIKKHQCPSCGGNLTVDNEKQMYHCTFCGSTYDYEYFREEQMHEMGETYLSRREFMAAADAYRFVLKKDPHDFLSLRGLMLASGKLKNINELTRENKSNEFSYNPKIVSEAVEGALEEDKEYFESWGKIYSDKKRLSDCTGEIESLGKDRRRIDDTISLNDKARYEYYFKDQYGIEYSPKSVFNIIWIADVIVFLLTFIGVVSLFLNGEVRTALSVVILSCILMIVVAVFNLTLVFPKVKKINEIETTMGELYAESGKITEKIRELDTEADKLTVSIRTSTDNLVKNDRMKMSDKNLS